MQDTAPVAGSGPAGAHHGATTGDVAALDEFTQLAKLFHPRSVALVGVSGRSDRLIARPLRYLVQHGFSGEVYPVNPNYEELHGLPCYPSLTEVPGPVDLVLVLVPAAGAGEVVRQCGDVGATAAVVFASGFAETGVDGTALQEELREIGRSVGVRVLGPNCQGLLYGPNGLAATFTPAADRVFGAGSGVAYVGQSGAVGGSVLDLAAEMGLSLTAWVSTGNQADLDLVEVAATLLDDSAVTVVMLYAEAITDGEAYTCLAEQAEAAGKQLVVLRSGRSDAGRRAAASHTGSMLGDDVAFELTSRRHGVVLVDDVDELLAVAATVRSAGNVAGRRVAVITTSGGAGSLAADHCAAHDLDLPELAAATQQRLSPLVPDFGAVANPVDVTAQLFNRDGHDRALGDICRIVAEDPDVDIVAVVLTMVTGSTGATLADDLVATAAELTKPLFVTWLAGLEQTREGREIFRAGGIPVFGSVGDLARTAGLLAPGDTGERDVSADTANDDGPDAAEIKEYVDLLRECAAGRTTGAELLAALGVSQPESLVATTAIEAAEMACRIGAPVAMKVQASSLAHKSDLGAVRLEVEPGDAAETFDELLTAATEGAVPGTEGVLVQEMVPPGVELLIGATSSPDGFPPVITVGMGGVTTELYRDVASALAPVDLDEATRMLQSLRGWPLLAGFRGRARADVPSAARAVAAVSRMATAVAGHQLEFEINPLIVADHGRGAFAVDLLARMPDQTSRGPSVETESSTADTAPRREVNR